MPVSGDGTFGKKKRDDMQCTARCTALLKYLFMETETERVIMILYHTG